MSIPEVFFRETIDLNRYSNAVATEFQTTYNDIIDSTNNSVNSALDILNEFYANQEVKRRKSESNDIQQFLLLEFAGLFDGPEGRLKQAIKDDLTVQSALDILSNGLVYEASLMPIRIVEN